MNKQPKIAIVHDWLTNLGGAERVVEALHEIYPEAPIYTSVYDDSRLTLFKSADVRSSFLQHWPLAKRKHQLYPTLRTYAFERFDFSGFDLVISSSSAEAKGVITSTETKHISYIHTPTRYYWSGYQDYVRDPGLGVLNPLARRALPKLVKRMRHWDFAAAQRPDVLVANSATVAGRIRRYYGRDSQVIFPPVDTKRFAGKREDKGYYLVVGRLIPYKRVDLAVQACSMLNKELVVVGRGSELKKLQRMAGRSVRFDSSASDQKVTEYMLGAKAFLFPGLEDFGITPVEAMAAGVPVIAYGQGGAAETVVDGKTGLLFADQNVSLLSSAIEKFETLNFSSKEIAEHSQAFSESVFAEKIAKVVDETLAQR